MAKKLEQIIRTEVSNLITGREQDNETLSFHCANGVLVRFHVECNLT